MRVHRLTICAAVAALVLGAAVSAPPPAADDPSDSPIPEYDLKALFLFNFTRFVDWPAGSLGKSKPLVIGVVQRGPIENGLGLIAGKKTKGHAVSLVTCQTVEDMRKCHVLFLNAEDDLWIKIALRDLRDSPVLTVGEREGFTRWGGIVNFHMEEGRLRLDISPKAAQRAGLRISAQLLELARLVDKNEAKKE